MKLTFLLALRYTINKKRHTILTLVGIILSMVLMVTAFAAVNTVTATRRNIIAFRDGTYHVLFNDITKDQLIVISNMNIFSRKSKYGMSVYTDSVFSDLESMGISEISYLSDKHGNVLAANFLRVESENIDLLPANIYALDDGRLPEKDGEIVLSATDRERFGYPDIGDTVRFLVTDCVAKGTSDGSISGDSAGMSVPAMVTDNYDVKRLKTAEFKVVGFGTENSMIAYSDSQLMSYIPQLDKLLVCFDDMQNDYYWDLHFEFQDNGLEIDDFDFTFNQEYLNMINKGVEAHSYNAIFFALVYIGILFLMFCVRMVIDNSFEISSHERIRQFGVLRAAGASKGQILRILINEALILSAVGVPVGILIGCGITGLIYKGIVSLDYLDDLSTTYDLSGMMEYSLTVFSIVSSFVIGVFWVLISAIGTGMRVNKFTPVEAVRAAEKRTRVRKTERKATVEKLGIERLVAFRSIRRNNKRFIITVLSMAMSITAFVVLSYAVEVINVRVSEMYSDKVSPFDYTVTYSDIYHEGAVETEKQIFETGLFRSVQYDSYIQYIATADDCLNDIDTQFGYYYLKLHPVNSETYKMLTGKDDYDEFEKSGKIIVNDTVKRTDTYDLYKRVPESISVVAVVDFTPFPEEEIGVYGTFHTYIDMYSSKDGFAEACIAESVYSDYVKKYGGDGSIQVYGILTDPQNTTSVYVRKIYANPYEDKRDEAKLWMKRRFYDSYTDNHEIEKMLIAFLHIAKICGYIAIGLITLVAVVNIVNIISTNVINRTSEIGMLRACGMSSKQIMKMIFSESYIYAGFSSLCALLAVEGLILVVMLPFMGTGAFTMEDMPVKLSFFGPLKYIIIGAVAAFIAAFAAAAPSVKRIIDTPIVEAVENID